MTKGLSSSVPLLNGTTTTSSYQRDKVASRLRAFLHDLGYAPTISEDTDYELETYMRDLMHTRGLQCSQLEDTLHLSASVIKLCSPSISLEAKKNAALYAWFMFYVDDMVLKDPMPFREFGRRVLLNQPQLDPVLTVYKEVLDKMWDLCLEPQIEGVKPRLVATKEERFALFLRQATGVTAYALINFTKEDNFTAADLIQALPNLSFWFMAMNDVLSFHKEELNEENGTYISNRAYIENKSRYEIFVDVIGELKVTRQTISQIMENINQTAVDIWKRLEQGYIRWHISQDRYRLRELGFY